MIKRYYESIRWSEYEGMIESDDGEWVKYDDVQPLFKELSDLRDFHRAIECAVNWTYQELKK